MAFFTVIHVIGLVRSYAMCSHRVGDSVNYQYLASKHKCWTYITCMDIYYMFNGTDHGLLLLTM